MRIRGPQAYHYQEPTLTMSKRERKRERERERGGERGRDKGKGGGERERSGERERERERKNKTKLNNLLLFCRRLREHEKLMAEKKSLQTLRGAEVAVRREEGPPPLPLTLAGQDETQVGGHYGSRCNGLARHTLLCT